MNIALDVMGGDNAPHATIEGAIWAARDLGITVQLVGQPDVIQEELARQNATEFPFPIFPASQTIEMDEQPSVAVKNKPDSSMVVAAKMVKEGKSDAFLTMGNTGGALAASLFHIGRIPGIKRPANSTVFPTATERGFCFLLDVGANADCKPEHLYQFALMGSLYAEHVLGIPNPRVAIISNGEEEGKGNTLVKETVPLLKQGRFNFIGNVEGKDVPAGVTDVAVTDGFTGNVMLKASEGVAKMIVGAIKEGIQKSAVVKVGALLARPALEAAAKKLDYREFGGAALLGIDGVVVIGHGRSDSLAVRNAIRLTRQAVESDIVGAIKRGLENE
jgi:phosphate acyltransferase